MSRSTRSQRFGREWVVLVLILATSSTMVGVANSITQVTMTVSYSVVGGGSPAAPTFSYVGDGEKKTYTLSMSPADIQVDQGSPWSVAPNLLSDSTSHDRWYSNGTLNGTASTQTILFLFYHQYLQTLSYSVNDDSSGYSPPAFTSVRFGSLAHQTLEKSQVGYWFDSGFPWILTNPLPGSRDYVERWWTLGDTSGTIRAGSTTVFLYQHQYYLKVDSSDGGVVMPSSSWQEAGKSVQITAAPLNSTYSFSNWIGIGTGNYTGTDSSATVTMNSAIAQRANFTRATGNLTSVAWSLVIAGLLLGLLGLVVESRAVLRIRPAVAPPAVRAPLKSHRPRAVCSRCQHANRESARFCTRCGATLSRADG